MGKWVLRYLFSNLISEELRRDEEYRNILERQHWDRERLQKENVLTLPLTISMTDVGGSPVTTPIIKPTVDAYSLFPQTPGLGIAIATPNATFITTPWDDSTNRSGSSMDRQSGDYFSAGSGVYNGLLKNGGTTLVETNEDSLGTPNTEKEKEEKDSSLFGTLKWRSFGSKKLGRSVSTDMGSKSPLPTTDEKFVEQAVLEEPSDKPDRFAETLAGVIQRIRMVYDMQGREVPGEPVKSAISPSLPQETPVLKPPRNTTIIVQEDKPDSGGVADLYRGTVECVGEDADLLERVAPAWLGELLLLNHVPFKETMKVSFVLIPWQEELPVLSSESGRCVSEIHIMNELDLIINSERKNSRLNANRMLRAKKIMGYVAEHLQPPFMSTSFCPETKEGKEPLRSEDWLELVCNSQVPPGFSDCLARVWYWVAGYCPDHDAGNNEILHLEDGWGCGVVLPEEGSSDNTCGWDKVVGWLQCKQWWHRRWQVI